MAAVAGKPELVAAVAAVKAEEAKIKADKQAALELAVPGLAAYEAASTAYSNAEYAYDRASDSGGYPVKEARAAKEANEVLQLVFADHPATKLWAKIEKYTQSSNYEKASAGDAAKAAVLDGTSISEAVEKMESDWSAAAHRAVENS
jgi:hypothetical protein